MFNGGFIQIARGWCEPKPAQRNGPPILVGGYSKSALRSAVLLGDGWHPAFASPAEIRIGIETMKSVSQRAPSMTIVEKNIARLGQSVGNPLVEVYGRKGYPAGLARFILQGTSSEIARTLNDYEESRVHHFIVDYDDHVPLNQVLSLLKTFSREVMTSFK